MAGDQINTSYTSIEQQKVECRNKVDAFIATSLGIRNAAVSLADTHKGSAADIYGNIVGTLTDEQRRLHSEIMAALDHRLDTWEELTKASEQRTAASSQTLSS